MKKRTTTFLTLLVGVTVLRATSRAEGINQSDQSFPFEQAIGGEENFAGQRPLETPQVVLQLKYDGGELNKIYLAQFRKGSKGWQPSVPARTNLCSDLCYAGLGGASCGAACHDLIPVGLKSALHEASLNETIEPIGEPRTYVCPTLCANNLGEPLCNCGNENMEIVDHVDWVAICKAFCDADRYVLGGCPVCQTTDTGTQAVHVVTSTRLLSTTEGWSAWCNVQCRQGQGGAACNCDRAPFQ